MVEIDAIDDNTQDELVFRIRIKKSMELYDLFDADLRAKMGDAIIFKNRLNYIEAIRELVARLEKSNGKT